MPEVPPPSDPTPKPKTTRRPAALPVITQNRLFAGLIIIVTAAIRLVVALIIVVLVVQPADAETLRCRRSRISRDT